MLWFQLPYKLVSRSVAENDEKPIITLNSANFAWNSGQEDLNLSSQEITCRNSVQGKFLLVDDKGKRLLLHVNTSFWKSCYFSKLYLCIVKFFRLCLSKRRYSCKRML